MEKEAPPWFTEEPSGIHQRTNADPLLDFCLDDLTHKERDVLESELSLAAGLQQALRGPIISLTVDG
jgi:hypothetical protein